MHFTKLVLVAVAAFCQLSLAHNIDQITQLPAELDNAKIPDRIFVINQSIRKVGDRLWRHTFRDDEKSELIGSIRYWLNFNLRVHTFLKDSLQSSIALPLDKQAEEFKKARTRIFEMYVADTDGDSQGRLGPSGIDTLSIWSGDDAFLDVNELLWKFPSVIEVDQSTSPWSVSKTSEEDLKKVKGGKYVFNTIKELPGVIQSLGKKDISVSRILFHGGKVRVSQLSQWLKEPSNMKYEMKVFGSYSIDPKVGVHFVESLKGKLAELEQTRIAAEPAALSFIEQALASPSLLEGAEGKAWLPVLFVRMTNNGMTKTISDWSEYPDEMEILRIPETFKVLSVKSMKATCSKLNDPTFLTRGDALLVYAADAGAADTTVTNSEKTESDLCRLFAAKDPDESDDESEESLESVVPRVKKPAKHFGPKKPMRP